MSETAYEWVLVIRAGWTRLWASEFESPVTADEAWDQARRKLSLEDLDEVTEVRAIPVRSMGLITFSR